MSSIIPSAITTNDSGSSTTGFSMRMMAVGDDDDSFYNLTTASYGSSSHKSDKMQEQQEPADEGNHLHHDDDGDDSYDDGDDDADASLGRRKQPRVDSPPLMMQRQDSWSRFDPSFFINDDAFVPPSLPWRRPSIARTMSSLSTDDDIQSEAEVESSSNYYRYEDIIRVATSHHHGGCGADHHHHQSTKTAVLPGADVDANDANNTDDHSVFRQPNRHSDTRPEMPLRKASYTSTMLQEQQQRSQQQQKQVDIIKIKSIADVAMAFMDVIDVKDRKYRLRSYPKCFVGSDAVTNLVQSGLAASREDAVHMGRTLANVMGLFSHVTGDHVFMDEMLFYRFKTDEENVCRRRTTICRTTIYHRHQQKFKSSIQKIGAESLRKIRTIMEDRSDHQLGSSNRSSSNATFDNSGRSSTSGSFSSPLSPDFSLSSSSIDDDDVIVDPPRHGIDLDDVSAIIQKAKQFHDLMDVKDRKYGLRTFKDCFVGSEAVDRLLEAGLAKSRDDAVQLGRILAKEVDLFVHVTGDWVFTDDYLFYRFREIQYE